MKKQIMKNNIGDLVHIPQSVTLIAHNDSEADAQLTIPLRIKETEFPSVGIVTSKTQQNGYLKVYCDGDEWSVDSDSVYTISGV